MKTYIIDKKHVKIIFYLLNQYGGPVKIDFGTLLYTDLTYGLISQFRELTKISNDINSYLELNEIEFFTLIRILDFTINNLGVDEFGTVSPYDFYRDGIILLNDLRRKFRGIGIENN